MGNSAGSWSNPFGTYHVGDVLDVLRTLPAESVQCVVTSPPYWALRDYGTATWEGGDAGCDHKQGRPGFDGHGGFVDEGAHRNRDGAGSMGGDCPKCGAKRIDAQIGLEATPEAYVARMVEVFREVRRVLRADGTAWVNLGDSYAGSTNGGAAQSASTTMTGGRKDFDIPARTLGGLKPKDLVGIPWRVAFALQADGWWLRSDIIWQKPNPMPESVTDRPTKSHEHVFLLTKRADYYYDATAIAEPSIDAVGVSRGGSLSRFGPAEQLVAANSHRGTAEYASNGTRNARDVWTIATAPYAAAHFATFPPELVKRCILAGTSERGCCPTCGSPWEREVTKTINIADNNDNPRNVPGYKGLDASNQRGAYPRATVTHETTGWRPTCEHGETPVPCTILDPFMGSGTSALVAQSLNRRWVGIDLSPEYAALAQDRCGNVNAQMALA